MTPEAQSISLRGVSRQYGAHLALRDVALTLPAGAITALLGASGSGKSTLLRLIAGLEPVDAGEIRIGDARVSTPHAAVPPEHRRVGMVFQDFALFPHLTAHDNVAFGMRAIPKDARAAQAKRWLALVGLATKGEAFPHQLSGGEQQRVALARALAPQPQAVLLDEPFSGLDPVLRAELRDVTLRVLRETGATAAFVTHDADEALYVADQLAILKDGRLLQVGAPRAVYDHPTSPEAAAALGPINTVRTIVRDGVAITPFGPVSAAGVPDGPAIAAVRAEAVHPVPAQSDAPTATLVDRRAQGAHDLVFLESEGVIWKGIVEATSRLEPGARTGVALGPRGAHCFAISGG